MDFRIIMIVFGSVRVLDTHVMRTYHLKIDPETAPKRRENTEYTDESENEHDY